MDVHTYRPEPSEFAWTFGGVPPVRTVRPGDILELWTEDAFGGKVRGPDDHVSRVIEFPFVNPQTGPFFVEGAEPGDMIVVTFDKLELNRTTAYSGGALAPYTVTPSSLLSRTERQAPRANWLIDKAKGTARLDNADIGGLELRLRPMLGCVGVAPARKEAIVTTTPGAFGGNMDYAGLNQGVKVMLPVNEPGALLFIGDGHALQGEGEVVGTGLETSMDVEFTVQVVKKSPIQWPRLENDTHVMVLGSERSLIEALQQATSEMHRWLMQDYGLSERGASLLMGQALEYEVANVVDPRFTMVAKMRKSTLAGLKARQ